MYRNASSSGEDEYILVCVAVITRQHPRNGIRLEVDAEAGGDVVVHELDAAVFSHDLTSTNRPEATTTRDVPL
jgi:hypothetical protein